MLTEKQQIYYYKRDINSTIWYCTPNERIALLRGVEINGCKVFVK